jgi:hypothetical protein
LLRTTELPRDSWFQIDLRCQEGSARLWRLLRGFGVWHLILVQELARNQFFDLLVAWCADDMLRG